MKAYLDSNILIDYVWTNEFTEKRRRPNGEIARMFRSIDKEEFEPIISNFSLMELAKHLRDYFLLMSMIRDGFSYREFSRERVNYSIDVTEEEKVDSIVADLESHEKFTFLKVTNLEPAAIEKIECYIKRDIDLIDAFHLQIALTAECECLVTKDNDFRVKASQLAKGGSQSMKIKVLNVAEFMQLKSSA